MSSSEVEALFFGCILVKKVTYMPDFKISQGMSRYFKNCVGLVGPKMVAFKNIS